MYALKFTSEGLADAKSLPKNVRNSLKKALLRNVALDPFSSSEELTEPLSGWRSFHWRDYRVVFQVFDKEKVVAIAGIGERGAHSESNIYRKLEALAAHGRLADQLLVVLRDFSAEK